MGDASFVGGFLDEIVVHIIVWKWTREMWDRMDDVEKESYYVFLINKESY